MTFSKKTTGAPSELSTISEASGNSFRSDLIQTTQFNLVAALIGLCTGIMASRFLGPHGRGELAAIQNIPVLIATIGTLGLPDAVVYFIARNKHEAKEYLASALVLGSLLLAVFCTGAFLAMPRLLAAQSPQVVGAARLYLVICLVMLFAGLPVQALRAVGNMRAWNVLRMLTPVLWLLLLGFAFLLNHKNAGDKDAIWLSRGNLVLQAFLVICVLIAVNTRLRGAWLPSRSLWPPMLSYGVFSVGTTIPQVLNIRLDQLMMAAILPPRDLGLYVVAVAWSNSVFPFTVAVSGVLFPKVASLSGREEQIIWLSRGTRLGALLACTAVLLVLPLTPLVLPFLFGRDFRESVPVALLLVVATAIAALNGVIEDGLRGLGAPKLALLAEVAGLAVTIAALLMLLKHWGIMGAGWASLAGYSSTFLVLTIGLWQTTKAPFLSFIVPSRSDARMLFAHFTRFLGRRTG